MLQLDDKSNRMCRKWQRLLEVFKIVSLQANIQAKIDTA